jgi:hypothetical protein
LDCIDNTQDKNYTLNGIYIIQMPPGCSFKVTQNKEVHQLLPNKKYFPSPGVTDTLPLIISVPNENEARVLFTSILSDYPFAAVWRHLTHYWSYYLVGVGIFFGALIVYHAVHEANWRLKMMRVSTSGMRSTRGQQKRVYIRNPLLR